jgi:hypothetical protein
MTEEELRQKLEAITRGADGALLGTDWSDASRGKPQCDYVIRSGDAHLCCALARGHAHGHRDSFVRNQPPQARWFRLVP